MAQKLSLTLFALFLFISAVAGKDVTMKCAACHLVVEEFEWQISQTDPEKTLQVGSYRIHPDGTQKTTEVVYRRSETQLYEILEDICVKSREYIQINDTRNDSVRTIYVRQNPRDGKLGYRKNVVISSGVSKKLKFACDTIVEDYEEDILEIFKEEKDGILKYFCVETTEYCSEDDLYDVNIVLPHELKPLDAENDDQKQTESETDSEEQRESKSAGERASVEEGAAKEEL